MVATTIDDMEDHYSILECSPCSSTNEIKQKYQKLILKYHPDKRKIDETEQCKTFQKINEAWNVLKDPETRREYDESLKRLEICSNPPIYETVNVDDLDVQDDLYFYNCRCGGEYMVCKSDVVPPECLVGCSQCSFYISIKV